MTLLASEPDTWMPSQTIAGSLNVHPVLVRKELGALKTAELIRSKEGKQGGYKLARSADTILLSELFDLVRGENHLLGFSKNEPNPKCPIGKQMNKHLDQLFNVLDANVRQTLEGVSLATFKNRF